MAGATSITIPPPVQGYNTRDPISEMQPTYAVDCENFFSDGFSVDLRDGNSAYSAGFMAGSLFSYQPQTGTARLIATGSGSKMWRINAGSQTDITGGAANILTQVSAVNFRSRIFFASGNQSQDTMDVYSWNNSGNIALAAFTGPSGDDKALFNVTVYKSRLYFCGTNSLSIWYGGVDATTGTLTEFPLQSIFNNGGKLLFCGTTNRSGQLDQEYFCAISDQGEVLVYQGDSPSSSTWALVGHFFMPPPATSESFIYWGRNLVIITIQGLVLLADVMSGENDLVFLSDAINKDFSNAVQVALQNGYRVSGKYYPKGNRILITLREDSSSPQTPTVFAMSTINRSWWKFKSLNFNSGPVFCVHNQELYFTGGQYFDTPSQGIYIFTGDKDVNFNTSGVLNRTIKLRSAFNYFGDRTHVKTFTSARPVIYQSEGLSLTMGCDVDYSNTTATSLETDLTDTSYKLYQPIMGLRGIGKCASIRIDGTVTTKKMSLQAIEVFYTQGGLV